MGFIIDSLIIIVSIVLVFASTNSFTLQYHRIKIRRDVSGISSLYGLFNTIVATEHVAIFLHYFANRADLAYPMVNASPTVIDWLNLAQFSVNFFNNLLLFGYYVYYLPSSKSGIKFCILATHVGFFLISFVAVLLERVLEDYELYEYAERLSTAFLDMHSVYIIPIATVLAAIALFPQRHDMLSCSDPGSLSSVTLVAQAVVLFATACLWPMRFTLGNNDEVSFVMWYRLVGWAVIDDFISALVQGALFWTSRKFRDGRVVISIAGEISPKDLGG
ncbi:hypothetical protein F4806DRAFT_461726 [Annulohypoxylon nitens]|nr:hypothetical protein F4806DRAFT_461726 [Annulohypoxylon nitens]